MNNFRKDATISIEGRQLFEGAGEDAIELVTGGEFRRKKDVYYISYDESKLTGLDKTRTTIEVSVERVVLNRTGDYPMQIIFEKGKRHLSLYDTEEGALTIAVNTRDLKNGITDRGGTLEIDYAIEIDHALSGINLFRLDVREGEAPLNFKLRN